MKKRTCWSEKEMLLQKAREAMMAAVSTYNNPLISFKTELFITTALVAWTYLLHAFFKSQGLDYRYFEQKDGKRKKYTKTKYGAFKMWELDYCLRHKKCPLDKATVENLFFLIQIRNEIVHQMSKDVDSVASSKIQACAINFSHYIVELFGDKYDLKKYLYISIQFSKITPEQREDLTSNPYLPDNIRNFLAEFETNIEEEILHDPKYAYRVIFVPKLVQNANKADESIEFVAANSAIAKDVNKAYAVVKETEKKKYLPKEIVDIMQKKGYKGFRMHEFVQLWKENDAKNNPLYGVMVSTHWFWYQSWLTEVEKICEANKEQYGYSKKQR